MNTEKFTQGEWFFEGENEVNTEQKNICRCIRLGMEAEEMKANAALIATAPEMLEMLDEVGADITLAMASYPGIEDETWQEILKEDVRKIIKLLKKARGEYE